MRTVKGYIPKKVTLLQPSLAESVGGVLKMVEEFNKTQEDVFETIEEKVSEVDILIEEVKETKSALIDFKTDFKGEMNSVVSQAEFSIEETVKEAVEIIRSTEPKEADEDYILEKLIEKIPQIDIEKISKIILAKVPQAVPIDETALLKKFLSKVPKNKASLKVIQESFETDPMSVIEKIMALPEGKFKLSTKHIDGLEQTIRAFQSQLARGYLHGGGDTVGAGTNITITTVNGVKIISSTGGSSSGYQTAIGSVNGSNVVFTFAIAPSALVVDGVSLRKVASDGTVNWTGTTIVTLSVPPNFDIYAVA